MLNTFLVSILYDYNLFWIQFKCHSGGGFGVFGVLRFWGYYRQISRNGINLNSSVSNPKTPTLD